MKTKTSLKIYYPFLLYILIGLITLLSAGCRGGGDSSNNATPVADAGTDQSVTTGNTVNLDGSGSSDADGDLLTYNWDVVDVPNGSSALLSDATAVSPTFTADVAGTYIFDLVVSDGLASSETDRVNITVSSFVSSSSNSYINLPQDSDGWTIFTPSSDTRIVYVSEDGDDSTGQVYNSTDVSDPFNPENEMAFATYAAAYANTRAGYPDWILFRRGDTFYEIIDSQVRDGRDSDEPFLISSYGDSGNSPLIMTGPSSASTPIVSVRLTDFEWVAISGINFKHYGVLDEASYIPGNPDYGGRGINIETCNFAQGLLIEGCVYENLILIIQKVTSCSDGSFSGVTLRRNVIKDSWRGGVTQGILISKVDAFVIEENTFDHNGWYMQNEDGDQSDSSFGQATMRSHNLYVYECNNYDISGNIFSRGASMGLKLCAEYVDSSNVIVNT